MTDPTTPLCPGCREQPRDDSDRHGFCPACAAIAREIANARMQAALDCLIALRTDADRHDPDAAAAA